MQRKDTVIYGTVTKVTQVVTIIICLEFRMIQHKVRFSAFVTWSTFSGGILIFVFNRACTA